MRSDHIAQLIEQIQGLCPKDQQLSRRVSELVCLTELITALHGAAGHREILDNVLLTILGQYPCRRGLILVKGNQKWRVGIRKGFKQSVRLSSLSLNENDYASRRLTCATELSPGLQKWAKSHDLQWLLPLWNGRQLVGLVALGGAMLGDPSGQTSSLLTMIADFAGVILGDQLAKRNLEILNRKLQQQMFQLRSLYELAGSFARCYEERDVFEVLAKNLMGLFFISRCAVLMEFGNRYQVAYAKGLKSLQGREIELPSLKEQACQPGPPKRETFCPQVLNFLEEQKLLYVFPIAGENFFHGWLFLGPRLNGQTLTDEDFEFLGSIATQAATALETVAMHKEMLEKKRMERELQLAREIQQQLLPKTIPQMPGYEMAVEMRPYQQVGGDFYDVIPLSDNRIALVLADVSGKSLPASMIMTTTQSCLRAIAGLLEISPVQAIQRLNQQLVLSTQNNRYVTLFFGILDPAHHQLTYINAGHNRPILVEPNGSVRLLDKGGMVVGLFPNPPYECETVTLSEGTQLLIYTDGLSEIVDDRNEEFSDERLEQILLHETQNLSAQETKDHILNQVMEFGKGKMIDDLTIMVLKRK
ncbi:MAG: serine/threonine-protein phosphatase [Acidobacteria bacterium]|nr:serine/threonine-protein phosphatase [Acidobacteriota bacterium]MCB9397512.1 serine/threonine-protein phosphatase [Acidobacteriota bacterium]